MAGSRQPIELLLLKGKKNLTKQEIEERKASELKPASDKAVKPPTYLPQDLKREFKKIAKDLVEVGIMSNLDVDCLARFLLSKRMYLQVTDELLKISPVITVEKDHTDEDGDFIEREMIQIPNDTYSELLQMQDKLFKQCRSAASDLGLSISSRVKLVVPKKEDSDKPPNEFEQMFGDV